MFLKASVSSVSITSLLLCKTVASFSILIVSFSVVLFTINFSSPGFANNAVAIATTPNTTADKSNLSKLMYLLVSFFIIFSVINLSLSSSIDNFSVFIKLLKYCHNSCQNIPISYIFLIRLTNTNYTCI